MDFDNLENLSDEDVKQLYDDIAEKDNLACTCLVNSYGIVIEYSELLRAYFVLGRNIDYCDSEISSKYSVCQDWCDSLGEPPIDEMIGRTVISYIGKYNSNLDVTIQAWQGSVYGNILYGNGCWMPPDAECDEGWTRAAGRWTTGALFRKHCAQN